MKKILLSILMLAAIGISFPKTANAVIPVEDIPLTAVAVTIATAVGVTAQSSESLTLKEFFLDQIAYMLGKMVLRELTSSVVTWINSGFDGNPAFVSNPGEFFKTIGDEALGQMIMNDKYLGFLCSPFSIDLKLQLAFKYQPFQKRIACTLTDVIANASGAIENASINGFTAGDFAQGNWPAFVEMTTEPQNNLYGAYVQADYELSARISTLETQKRDELNQGRGFLSWKKCSDNAAPGDKEFLGPTQPGEGQNNVPSDEIGPVADPNSYQRTEGCDVYTPGSVIANAIDTSYDSPVQELHLADEINEIVNALFAQMVKQVLTSGLRGLSGSGARDPDSYISQLQEQQAATNEQLTGLKNKILQGIEPLIIKETEYKTYKDQSLNKLLQTKTKLDTAKMCFVNKLSNIPNLTSTQTTFGQSKIGEIESVIQIKVSPKSTTLLSELTGQDSLLNSLRKIKTDAQAAKTVNEIAGAAQLYGSYTSNPGVTHLPADIDSAKTERDRILTDMGPVDQQADRFMQQCVIFPVISAADSGRVR
jgi:hypothetical protein